ncbi:hypothetical protein [Flavobacterium sp.]|uniref:hypothetical protein n=1 Tax=Flavobacterium sp. TaxID=239 RepID=UPI00286BA500|nr:hypothetical protein [Flavobacterium sp.]
MKKTICLVLITLLSISSFAQEIPFKIQKSEEFKDDIKKSNIVLTETNENGNTLIVRSYNDNGMSNYNGFYIEHIDSNLKIQKTFDFEMRHPNYQKNNIVLGIYSLKNEVKIIEFYYDLKDKSYVCQANIITDNFQTSKKVLFRISKEKMKETGTISIEKEFFNRTKGNWANDNSGEIKSENDISKNSSFFEFSWDNKSEMSKDEKGSDIVMTVNENKSAFAIAIDYNSENKEYVKLYLFDNELNKKMDTDFKREIKDKDYKLETIQVSPDGNAISLLAKNYSEVQKAKKEGGKYLFEITKITTESQKPQFIDTNENFVGSLKSVFHNNDIICFGFYSDIKDYRFKGICYYKLDFNSLAILQTKYNLFTEQFMLDKYGENKDKALKFLTFKKIFFSKNDGLIFNAQEEYLTSDGNNRTYLHYDDVVVAKLDSKGNLLWARNINKSQAVPSYEDESFISYTSFMNENFTYFFINTAEKINKIKNDRIEFGQIRKNKSNLNVIRINQDGDFDYEEILDDEKSSVPFMVSKGAIINNSVLFLGRKGTNKQLLKVTL